MRAQQMMEMVLPIYSKEGKASFKARQVWLALKDHSAVKAIKVSGFTRDFYRLNGASGSSCNPLLPQTTGQACSLLVYRSAAEARFWLFITSRRFRR